MSDRLNVWIGDRHVAVVEPTRTGTSVIVTYTDEHLADRQATPLSLAMPVQGRRYRGSKVDAYLWGFLPDDAATLAQWAREAGTSRDDILGILAHVGNDVAGPRSTCRQVRRRRRPIRVRLSGLTRPTWRRVSTSSTARVRRGDRSGRGGALREHSASWPCTATPKDVGAFLQAPRRRPTSSSRRSPDSQTTI